MVQSSSASGVNARVFPQAPSTNCSLFHQSLSPPGINGIPYVVEVNAECLLSSGTIVGLDMCFDLNRRGEEGANCGRSKYGYNRCTPPYVSSTFTLNT